MLSDRAGLRVVLAIKRIPMKAASRFLQIPCPCSSITGALKRSCNFVFVNSPTLMDDSWQKFMNPMNDDAVGPAAPPHFAHLLTHSLHPSHSILGVALDGWRNRHPGRTSIPPSRRRRRCPPNPALPCPALPCHTQPTHASFRRSTDTIRYGEGRARRRASGSGRREHSHPARRVHATKVEGRERGGRNVRGIFEQALLCNNGVLEGGRGGKRGEEEAEWKRRERKAS